MDVCVIICWWQCKKEMFYATDYFVWTFDLSSCDQIYDCTDDLSRLGYIYLIDIGWEWPFVPFWH